MKPLSTRFRRHRRSILLTAAAVIFTATFLPFAARFDRTNRVIAAATAPGATVSREFAGPDWLGNALNYVPRVKSLLETRIYEVTYPTPQERNFKPIDLRYLEDAPDLRMLDLMSAYDVTDADLQIVGQLEQLTNLSIYSSKVTNNGLMHLKSLHRMEFLWLSGSGFDDEGLHCLSSMPKLRILWFDGSSGFTGEGLKHLPQECRLESLHVTGTGFTHGLELIDLRSLNYLSARVTPLTDAGLAPLKDAQSLEMLSLNNTQVTDEGLRHLEQLPQLTTVLVVETPVTQAGAERLVAKLPRVSVAHGPTHKQTQWTDGPESFALRTGLRR